MQATQTDTTCAGCGFELDVPPAIAALVGLLGEEMVCVACHDAKEDDDGA